MPRRAKPGDEAAIRAALTPKMREVLDEMRETNNVFDFQLLGGWTCFTQTAVIRLAGEYVSDGIAPSEAINLAADALGVERETVKTRARSWPRDSRGVGVYQQAGSRTAVASLCEDAATDSDTRKAA